MKSTLVILIPWGNALNGAKIAPTASDGIFRLTRTKRNKKNSSSLKKSVDKPENLCYNTIRKREGKPTKPAD